jgi:predicted nucleic acid-binding Zn ribbon protein
LWEKASLKGDPPAMSFSKLMDILKKAQERYPRFSKRWVEAEALGRWEKAVGPQIARHTRAIRVQDAVLWVEVDHPIWKSELHYRKRQILEILNKAQPVQPGAPPQETLVDILYMDPRRGYA